MAPKEKPKTKKELKAEQEAAARAAEEERLRQEEEARRVAQQLEQRRQELLEVHFAERDARLAKERQELVPFLQQLQRQRAQMAVAQAATAEWEQFLSCSPLPDPHDRPAMNAFLSSTLHETDTSDLQKTLQQCEACFKLAEQCSRLAAAEDMATSLQGAFDILVGGAVSTAQPSSTTKQATTPSAEERPVSSRQSTSSTYPADAADAVPAAEHGAADAAADAQPVVADAAELTQSGPPSGQPATSAAACSAAPDAACSKDSSVWALQYQQDVAALHDCIKALLDAATAHVLHRADEYADPKGDVLLTAQQGPLQWGLWVNTQKNPRFKLLELSGLGMSIEIPKQLALANIAVYVQRHPCQPCCINTVTDSEAQPTAAGAKCLASLGGVLQVELLTLPPPPKHSKGWTVRQVTPQSSCVNRVPYPIPPVGENPATWKPDEEPPPLHFSLRLPDRLLVPAAVRVGWWDASQQAWSEDGISNVQYDPATGRLSFSSIHLGCLALLQDTSARLPYDAWTIRPSGGLGGSTAVVDLQVPGLPSGDEGSSSGSISLEVGSGWVKLRGPALPQLGHILGRHLPPWELLAACEACGIRLTPASKEVGALGLQGKEAAGAQAMCADLALLCTKFLVASSRWNLAAGPDVLLVRLSEVTDWEEGGRTSSQAAARIFSREATDGPWRVLVARREGVQGVACVDGGNNRAEPPPPVDLSTVQAVQAASQDESTWMHASLLHLLRGQQGREEPLLEAAGVDAGFVGSMTQLLQALNVFVVG